MKDEVSRSGASRFSRRVGAKESRKLKARRRVGPGVWFGVGMFGLVGWSVAVPALLGAMLGLWFDKRHGSGHGWTFLLMMTGLVLGCWNAWRWILREMREPEEEEEDDDE